MKNTTCIYIGESKTYTKNGKEIELNYGMTGNVYKEVQFANCKGYMFYPHGESHNGILVLGPVLYFPK